MPLKTMWWEEKSLMKCTVEWGELRLPDFKHKIQFYSLIGRSNDFLTNLSFDFNRNLSTYGSLSIFFRK